MTYMVNLFVRLKFWIYSWFWTPEDMVDLWMARQVLSLSPRPECTRPRYPQTPPSKQISCEKPPLVPRSRSSSGFSTIRDDSSSDGGLGGTGTLPCSFSPRSCVTPCTSPSSTWVRNLSPSSPVVFFDPKAIREQCHLLGVDAASVGSSRSDPGTYCSHGSVVRRRAKAAVRVSSSLDLGVSGC